MNYKGYDIHPVGERFEVVLFDSGTYVKYAKFPTLESAEHYIDTRKQVLNSFYGYIANKYKDEN